MNSRPIISKEALSKNPGVDTATIREARRLLEEIRRLGLTGTEGYRIDLPVGGGMARPAESGRASERGGLSLNEAASAILRSYS